MTNTSFRTRLLAATAAAVLAMSAGSAVAQEMVKFDIAPQSLGDALKQFGYQSGHGVLASPALADAKVTRGVSGEQTVEVALNQLLEGSGLTWKRNGDTFLIVSASDPQSGSAAGDGADGTVAALIVTAQKREENIQDVPIAISAFTQESLDQQKIEGGPDLMRGVPNLTFSKSNFTSYNISIRGIGTKAISATTDPGVAVSFNNVGLITNRFFEQEFFDLERLEVLRGPQGTLYGRNATGGVVNLITAKPKLNDFDGWIKGEVGNYHTKRASAMVNVPLIEDKLAVRVAGALTDRQGYDYNSVTKNAVNGRDLWSLRTTVAFEPAPWLRANFIWERFREDDNRSRTGKQLCHRDDSPDVVGSTPTRRANSNYPEFNEQRAAFFSTGCKAGSLYDDNAFGTPNGLALGYVAGANTIGEIYGIGQGPGPDGTSRTLTLQKLIAPIDPYGGLMQSRDLHEIASFRDPLYRAKSDILELNLDIDVTDSLTFSSQTAWNWDEIYSFQDFNRFNTLPIFNDTSSYTVINIYGGFDPSPYAGLAPGGTFCDPQIGCSNTIGVFDVSSGKSKQFTQEFRLQSDFNGSFNFSIGGNYTKFKVQDDYYVMSNLLTAIAVGPPFFDTPSENEPCGWSSFLGHDPDIEPGDTTFCTYVDPNPVEDINGQGHNYFRSSNPYKLESWAVFGEAYYNIKPDLKVTAGLRFTKDRKTFTPVPSQLLLAPTIVGGGYVGAGYPANPDIKQSWGEFTGRAGVDWHPRLAFTDDTLLYAFYSRGYKAGGANPPSPGFATTQGLIDAGVITEAYANGFGSRFLPVLELTAVNYGPTFEPEFVNALELGTKNVLRGGRLTLNASAFFYDYKNYQVSQIRDRTAVNENFDAKVWGAELSAVFEPVDRLRLDANIGWMGSRIGKGEKSIDPMNRNLGNPDYTVVKPWVQLPSNCVVPTALAEYWLQHYDAQASSWALCGGLGGVVAGIFGRHITDPSTGEAYDPANYPELNGGAGLYTDLGGNELPNSPHLTTNIGAQYSFDVFEGWRMTVRGDAYWQSQSWARVYNLGTYDKLHGWYNANLSVSFERPDDELKIELYVKNLLDDTPITDAFLNSDDSGLTTNVFVLDPRLIGLSIRKGF